MAILLDGDSGVSGSDAVLDSGAELHREQAQGGERIDPFAGVSVFDVAEAGLIAAGQIRRLPELRHVTALYGWGMNWRAAYLDLLRTVADLRDAIDTRDELLSRTVKGK